MAKNPSYKNPPVVETVMGVQFPEIEGFRAVHFGLFWETLRDRYPTCTDQPRLKPFRESFPRRPELPPELQLRQIPVYPVDRVWYEAASGSELLQLQPDRFLFNWRQRENEYPSYNETSDVFHQEYDAFCNFCRDQGLQEPAPNSCEVTYLNHIAPLENETIAQLAGHIFAGLRWEPTEGFLPPPESVTFNRAFEISRDGPPIGRLHAETSVATKRTDAGRQDFLLFTLTARINHTQENELRDSLQTAHDWVVRGFADLTSAHAQKARWRREL